MATSAPLAVVLVACCTLGCDLIGGPHGDAGSTSEVQSLIANDDPLAREFAGSYPFAVSSNGVVREFAITAAEATHELITGRVQPVWAYNGRVPGPTLRVKFGETLRVEFKNELPQSTTIHWHGVRVPNAMDGVPGVTQDPVPPGGSFLYEFTPKDPGTFWFHPHIRSSEQVERGLFGVLIVEEPDTTPFSRELLWVVDDWLLNRDGTLNEDFVTRHDLAHDGRWGNLITVNGTHAPTFEVRPGERLRVRLVNVANGRVFDPRFEGLAPMIIAIDGMTVPTPVLAERMDLAPGNRVDLDLIIPRDAAGSSFQVRDGFSRDRPVVARISIAGPPVETPLGDVPNGRVPAWSNAAELEPTHVFRLNARRGGPYGIEWTINDQVMRHDDDAGHADEHETCSAPYALPIGRFAKLRFANESARLHPMHIHGQFFKVLARDGKPVDEPHWRDTVLVRGRETVDVGLVPLDEGRWMLHCHILEHADSGMMTLVEVATRDELPVRDKRIVP